MKPIFFLDLDTQKDFLYPDGAAYHPGGEKLLPVLDRITRFAQDRRLPIVSTACRHTPEGAFHGLAAHCLQGEDGANKVPETLVRNRHTLEITLVDRNMPLLVERYEQLVLEKEDFGLFANANASRLVSCLGGNAFVYGCGEESIQRSVSGLLERGLQVVIVEDACSFARPAGKKVLTGLTAAGARRIASRQLFDTLSG